MLRRRIFSLVLCLGMMTGLLSVSALAAEVKSGVYTASMVTTYYNPDTGNVDDGGTANAALGEGMCRSATDEICLVEVDGDDIWITVRLLLQSNCSNVAIYSRNGYDSYSQVSYDIMSEDAANDSIDYRIKVSDVGQKLKCTMYVSPMGRDVLWYLYVDTASLTAGSGDFVVSIDTSTPEPEPEQPAQQPETPATQPEKPAVQPEKPAAQETVTETTPAAEDPAVETPDSDSTTEDPAESTAEDETPEDAEAAPVTAETEPEETETEELPEEDDSAEEAEETEESTAESLEEPVAEEQGASQSTVTLALVCAVLVIVAGAVYYLVRKKR